MLREDTYPKLLIRNSRLWSDGVALRRKDMGIWQSYTWKDCHEIARDLCLGLVDLGLKPGDKVAVIGDDEPEGYLAEAAIQAAGGIVVALWSDSIPSEVAYIIQHSDSKFVLAEDQEQVDKILEIKNDIPAVQRLIYWDPKGMRKYRDPLLLSYKDLRALGAKRARAHAELFEELVSATKGTDIAQISYTSGTTSLPKGAMITHNAIIASAKRMQEAAPLERGDDVITTLASASVFHSWFAGYNYITGVTINFPEEPETLVQDYREISPRFILITPRQWESVSSMTQVRVNDAGLLKRSCYNFFLPVGYEMVDARRSKADPGPARRLLYKLGNLLVFAPLRDKLGFRKTKYPFTGSAFLSPDFFRFFQALGISLSQVYGSTESGVVSMHTQDDIDNDSVGKICGGVEIKISDTQEILVRGESIFSGYYKDPDKTEQAIRDGWFHTGDSGHINERNHLFYLDRIDNLDELSDGHRYAPAYIEGKLKFSRFIQDVMVIGGKTREYLSVIINIDFESIGKWAEAHQVPYTTFVDLSQKKAVSDLVRQDLVRVNKTLPEPSRVIKFVLLHKEFDADEGELTRTRKLRRSFLQKRYEDLIEAVYGNKSEVPVVTEVKYRDGRTGMVETSLKIRTVYQDEITQR
ncbi:MAG: AMP-binding protein [Desulfomonilaceae bacterium]|nr:AMP-binding protein [Desulfomonilaceae bacterium]